MPIHHFTLIVDGPDLQDDTCVDALFEAGCGDATVGRIDGIQYLDFDREAVNPAEAILSAVKDVKCVDGVRIVRIVDDESLFMAVSGPAIGLICEGKRLLVTGTPVWSQIPLPVYRPRSRDQILRVAQRLARPRTKTVNDQATHYGNWPWFGVTHSSRTVTWSSSTAPD